MPTPRCRPFTVLDAMILVAATAVGLWGGNLVWFVLGTNWESLFGDLGDVRNFGYIHACLTGIAFAAMPVMWVWTLTMPLLGLRRPRPTLRRLCRQPGFAACVAVFITTTIIALSCLASEAHSLKPNYRARLETELVNNLGWDFVTAPFGFVVAGVWVLFALGKMSRRDPGWFDRTGRVLGAYWVVELVLSLTRLPAD